ncbi:YdeI/OmpD-associated family protein [Planotetraspora sp. A-T 1434]|uniref:YdeI/OmpD-associated family protein n=1 Tax=Planotetraspora sp. A-T 1434 TaxID=2979219 RepID=UPI0021BF0DB5|nr:YdeI/OmpD-associated family protein [Planotetraspora sp. A-T 1434]MCT9930969.1 YdeI/OmpD-associated family protein [Planotetraspora sp. A-T 1434]
MEPTFFATPDELRAWFSANHVTESELWVGYYKKGTRKPSITWPESVDQALCFGWIDGVRKSVDEHSYKIRFTPRKPRSIWSAVNIAKVGELTEAGLMQPAGLKAFENRAEDRSAVYSHEQRQPAELPEEFEAEFRANPAAWEWFESRPAWYRRASTHWVVSAKREDTRRRRLAQLIDDSANARTIPSLTRNSR